jgi:DNA polymerase III subunit delta'
MGLHGVYGHDVLRNRLAGSISAGRFPQAALFSGPSGVGKQRLALWVAQSMLCDHRGPEPCGVCRPCIQVLELSHPDLHWFVPFPPSKRRSSDPSKAVEDAADSIAEIVSERRANALYGPLDPTASHPIASVRYLHQRVALRPFQGPVKVVIVGDADRLVVQEASHEAANALLKVLEEPPADTYFLLTTSSPQSLLPTVRSRLVPVRVQPVSDAAARRFLEEVVGVSPRALDSALGTAAGVPGRVATQSGTNGGSNQAADRLFAAVKRGPAEWAAFALGQQPWGARGTFTELLDAAATRLRSELEDRSQQGGQINRLVAALQLIAEHRTVAQGNINPQLALAVLALDLENLR